MKITEPKVNLITNTQRTVKKEKGNGMMITHDIIHSVPEAIKSLNEPEETPSLKHAFYQCLLCLP